MASSVSEIWRSVPSGEGAECTGDGTEIVVEIAVVTLVVVSTDELTMPATVSWIVKVEQSGATGEVGEVTVTSVVTASAATAERTAAAALSVAGTTADSRDKVFWSEET